MPDVRNAVESAVNAFCESLNDALKEAWQSPKFEPNSIVIPLRVFVYLRRPYMTKRGFRRWRARLRKRARA
jgi:hypothetical protein